MGQMMDFLKAYPSVTKEAYMWEWTVPQIRIASADATHVKYLTDKELEMRKAKRYDSSNISELSDIGVPIFGIDNNEE